MADAKGNGGDRRIFLKVLGAGAVAAGAGALWIGRNRRRGEHDHDAGPEEDLRDPAPRPGRLAFFDPHEYDTLDAVAGVLLPADDEDPGARESGAMIFVDRELANPAFLGAARSLKVADKALDFQAQHDHGKRFVELTHAQQDAVLHLVYRGGVDRGNFKGKPFVTLMMSLVLEGHLSEPIHGGNRDGMGWKLVAFEPMDPRPGSSGGHHHG